MNKRPIIIANWKMKLSPDEALAASRKLVKQTSRYKNTDLVICPSFTEIHQVAEVVKGSHIALGAQDCFWESTGAFTGEVSATALKGYGVGFVVSGHSERRRLLGETNEMVNKKVKMILTYRMTPVICVNESFEERQEGEKENIIANSVRAALQDVWLNKLDRIVIAYEPVWAIGSGQVPEPDEVEHTNLVIKQACYDLLPPSVVDEQMRFIYGGSVNPENVAEFLNRPTIDGALVGGASLDPVEFTALIAIADKTNTVTPSP